MVHSQQRLTATQFRQLPETNRPTELIFGEVIVSPAPKDSHQTIVGRVYGFFIEIDQQENTRLSPSDVYLSDDVVVQPDVFWIDPNGQQCILVDGYWHGAPDLVVEVLSPATALRDKRIKFNLYQSHGVREYWIIDPVAQYMEVWVRQDEHFQHGGVFGPDEQLKSTVLDADIPLKSIFNA